MIAVKSYCVFLSNLGTVIYALATVWRPVSVWSEIPKPLLLVSGISSWKIPLSFLNERGRGLIKPDEIEGLSVYHEGGWAAGIVNSPALTHQLARHGCMLFRKWRGASWDVMYFQALIFSIHTIYVFLACVFQSQYPTWNKSKADWYGPG